MMLCWGYESFTIISLIIKIICYHTYLASKPSSLMVRPENGLYLVTAEICTCTATFYLGSMIYSRCEKGLVFCCALEKMVVGGSICYDG